MTYNKHSTVHRQKRSIHMHAFRLLFAIPTIPWYQTWYLIPNVMLQISPRS